MGGAQVCSVKFRDDPPKPRSTTPKRWELPHSSREYHGAHDFSAVYAEIGVAVLPGDFEEHKTEDLIRVRRRQQVRRAVTVLTFIAFAAICGVALG